MALPPGTRLGPYEVTAQIGVGGMGEVYKATDTNLKRAVAIKVLPASVASDAERLARFQREAEVLAALNHPNIAAIYGLERSGATTALVMELVEGPTLADRITQAAIPIDEALPIAKQIAEALEAAHEQGIIHRDLKPANIKVRADGTVKVLDFGLAKAMEPTGAMPPSASMSPTITSPAMMTGVGMLLGTAAYMSPEQAKGRPADKRSDIWAFGCVLYEMLTGKRAFAGDDVAETVAFVITKPPEWHDLPETTPVAIRTLLRRCIEKDRKRRLADAADAQLEIDEALATSATEGARDPRANSERSLFWRPSVIAAGALVLGGLLVGGAIWAFKPTSASPTIIRFGLTLPSDQQFTEFGTAPFAISPDGTAIAYVANRQLYLRSISELQAKPI